MREVKFDAGTDAFVLEIDHGKKIMTQIVAGTAIARNSRQFSVLRHRNPSSLLASGDVVENYGSGGRPTQTDSFSALVAMMSCQARSTSARLRACVLSLSRRR